MQNILKKKYSKIGILGGSFNPPHNGHLYISKFALKKLKLSKLIWAITKKNPLKKITYLSIKTRIKLSKKILKKERKISVVFFDKKIKSNNTYDLLKYIKKRERKSKLYFIIGADNLVKFHKWYRWKEIPKLSKIVVFPRKSYLKNKKNYIVSKTLKKSDFIYVESKKVNISSSLIRKIW